MPAKFWHNETSCIHSTSPWLAPGWPERLSSQMGYSTKRHPCPLLLWTYAHSVEVPTWWRFHPHIQIWNGSMLPGWNWATYLSKDLHLLCRLPRKVSIPILLHHLILRLVRVLLATIRDQGICPCPCCLVPKSKLDWLRLLSDTNLCVNKACKYDMNGVNKAQKAIYKLGKPIGGAHVQWLLKATSAVPISVSVIYSYNFIIMTIAVSQNAFIEKPGPDFDLSWMLIVDFMHKFELGVWKALFMHLICILYAAAPGGRLATVLDERYDLSITILYIVLTV